MTETAVKPPLEWINVSVFAGLPLLAIVLLPVWGVHAGYDSFQWLWALAFLYLNGLSITGGYHRLWAHKTYQAHPALKWFYALWGAGALQNSILIWASDHRRHHRHVDDNDLDPYSAGRGLWFSHIGWMLRSWPSGKEDFDNVKDLMRDPIVMWQEKHYHAITWTMNLVPPLLVGLITGDWLANLLLMGFARLVFTHHTTFFINSLAHFWGRRPFSDENSARDNGFLAFFTYGEGYHNFHHRFQTDYRNGIRWFDYDPTKWLIRVCSWVGLTTNLKHVERFRIHEAQVAVQLKRAEAQLENTKDAEKWQAVLEQEYEHYMHCLEQWKTLRLESIDRGRERIAATGRDIKLSANEHVKALEHALKEQIDRLNSLQMQMAH